MKKPDLKQTLVTASLLLATSAALATEMQPGLWEITANMEMNGMKMPGGKNRICYNKADVADTQKMVPKDSKCQVSDVKQEGSRVSWKMECKGPEAMSGSGSVTFAATSYTGDMQIQMQSAGQAMQMRQQYSGKRVGDCTK